MKPSARLRKRRALVDLAAGLLLHNPTPEVVARALAMVECAKEMRIAEMAEKKAAVDP
jgi:hypothetical protein